MVKSVDTLGMEGMTCSNCKRNERQLEPLGIAMNIPLGQCNWCLKRAKAAEDVKRVLAQRPQVEEKSDKYKRAYELIESTVYSYDAILGAVRMDEDPLDAGVDFKDMAEAFIDLLKKMDEIERS